MSWVARGASACRVTPCLKDSFRKLVSEGVLLVFPDSSFRPPVRLFTPSSGTGFFLSACDMFLSLTECAPGPSSAHAPHGVRLMVSGLLFPAVLFPPFLSDRASACLPVVLSKLKCVGPIPFTNVLPFRITETRFVTFA